MVAAVLILLLLLCEYGGHALSATNRAKRQQRGSVQMGGRNRPQPHSKVLSQVIITTTTTTTNNNNNNKHQKEELVENSSTGMTTDAGSTIDREVLWSLAGQTSRRKRKRGHGTREEDDEDTIQGGARRNYRSIYGVDPTASTGTLSSTSTSTLVTPQVQPYELESVSLVLATPQDTLTMEMQQQQQQQQQQPHDPHSLSLPPLSSPIWLADVTFRNGTQQLGILPQRLHQKRDQAIWMATRAVLNVTASELGAIVGNSVFTTREQLILKKVLATRTITTTTTMTTENTTNTTNETTRFVGNQKACDWGLRMEPKALKQYVQVTGNIVKETGLHIRQFPATSDGVLLIGASPDGLILETTTTSGKRNNNNNNSSSCNSSRKEHERWGVLEIKSLWGRRHKKELPQFDRCPKRFYDQIQCQLAVCDLDFCDLMMYIPPTGGTKKHKNYCILRIERDELYWKETMLPAVQSFCGEVQDTLRNYEQTTIGIADEV
jgi:YqaJ-like viral recombinase domain